MDYLDFSPSLLDFGNVPVSNLYQHKELVITNTCNKTISIYILNNNPSFYFIKSNKIIHSLAETGFEVFLAGNPCQSVIIPPKSKVKLLGVLRPGNQEENINILIDFQIFPMAGSMDSSSDDEAEFFPEEDMQPTSTINYQIKAKVFVPEFVLSPPGCYIDDCVKDHPSTATFSITNKSPIALPLLRFVPKNIILKSSQDITHIMLSPNETLDFTLTYTPSETGKFTSNIEFECPSSSVSPWIFKLSTFVSPAKTPEDFPTFSPDSIDCGEMRVMDVFEQTITISNPSQTDYQVTVGSYSETSGSPPALFKTALHSSPEPQITIVLSPETNRTIFCTYRPHHHHKTPSDSTERRFFVVTMTFVSVSDGLVFYRRIPVKAAVCQTVIESPVTQINFGDIPASKAPRHASITIANKSPLSTTVAVASNSRWVALSSNKIELGPRETHNFAFSFYPLRVNPDFNCQLRFTNETNPRNAIDVAVSAAVLGDDELAQRDILGFSSDQKPVSSLDFSFTSASFYSVRQLTIKNSAKEPVVIKVDSSSASELEVFREKGADLIRSTSASSIASLSSVAESTTSSVQQPPSPNGGAPHWDTFGDLSMGQLYLSIRELTEFYNNMLTLRDSKEGDVVKHVEWISEQFQNQIENNLEKVNGVEIEIAPGSRLHLWVLLKPETVANLWKHRRESLSISLVDDRHLPPIRMPVSFNVARSTSFISALNLNYGKLVRKTIRENNIYLTNESCLPLIYRFEACGNCVTLKSADGVLPPLESRTIPIRFETPVEGVVDDEVKFINFLNPGDTHTLHFKAFVQRRANFYVDPLEIDFGEVVFGVGSSAELYLKNIEDVDNTYIFAHQMREFGAVRPMISFQYVNMSERHLSAAVEWQIEKQNRKLLCLVRKKKWSYADKVRKIIEQLKKTAETQTPMPVRSNAKYIDRCSIPSGPLQTHCLKVQFIPSLLAPAPPTRPVRIDGVISVYKEDRPSEIKNIKYKVVVRPPTAHKMVTAAGSALVTDKDELQFGAVFVQSFASKILSVTNTSQTAETPFWVSSNSSNDAILSFGVNEGVLKPNETIQIPIDLIPLKPGQMSKFVTIMTATSSITIPASMDAMYQKVLAFPTLPLPLEIDFGTISINSFLTVENRRSFDIRNITDKNIYVTVSNLAHAHVTVYEHDPSTPVLRPIAIDPSSTLRLNIRLRPELDHDGYRKYQTFVLQDAVKVMAFEDMDEATAASLHPNDTMSCVFAAEIPLKALVGRIGLSVSDKTVDFGCVERGAYSQTIAVRNRSSKIPLEVFCQCSQGLTVDRSHFLIHGHKDCKEPQELALTFKATVDGVNSAKLTMSSTVTTSMQTSVDVTCFVDPKQLQPNLERGPLGYYVLDVGDIYVNRGRAVPKAVSFTVKNISQMAIGGDVVELGMPYFLRPGAQTEVSFSVPPQDASIELDKPWQMRLHFRGRLTKAITQVVELTGRFVVSAGTITPAVVDLGSFIATSPEPKTINLQVANVSHGELIFDLTKRSSHIKMPKELGPIKGQSAVDVSIPVDMELLKGTEGTHKCTVIYTNRNNADNVVQLGININVIKHFLRAEGAPESEDGVHFVEFHTLREVTVDEENTLTAALFISLTNCINEDITARVVIEEVDPSVAKLTLFKRSAELMLTELQMQALETTDLRAKVTVSDREALKPGPIGRIIFEHPNFPAVSIDVVFNPQASSQF